MSDEEADAVVESYRQHIEQFIREVPADLRRLAKEVSLHDGLFRAVTVSAARATIELQLRCGDNQIGYYDLDIAYRGAQFVAPRLDELEGLLSGQDLEILSQEVDRTDDGYEHRLLLYPSGELGIRFNDVTVDQVSVVSRNVGMEGAPVCTVT